MKECYQHYECIMLKRQHSVKYSENGDFSVTIAYNGHCPLQIMKLQNASKQFFSEEAWFWSFLLGCFKKMSPTL